MPETRIIDLTVQDLALVQQILREYLPGRQVYVFGSRATGLARRRSDLDLAVDGAPLTIREHAILENAFDESNLPITVDVVDLAHAKGVFRRRIESEWIPFPTEELNTALTTREATAA